MTITLAAIWLPIIGTIASIIAGMYIGKPQGDYDMISGCFGFCATVGGTLAVWLIYFMVLYFKTK